MNQNQITMTRGDDRTLAIVVDDDYEGDPFTFTVDELFTKTGTVGADDGSGFSTATVTISSEDTEDGPDRRASYSYELSVDNGGATVTVRRGIFVLLPDLTSVD